MAKFYTYNDLKDRVGRRLGIVADTESVSAEDGEVIGNGLLFVEAALDTMDIYNVSVEEGVSEPFATPIVMMAAAQLVDEFGIPDPRRAQLKAEGLLALPGYSLAERQMRALADAPTTKLQTAIDFSVL